MFGLGSPSQVQTVIVQSKPEGKYAAMLIAAKIAKASAKSGFKATRWATRRGYTYRRKMAPIYTAIALQTTAWGLHMLPGGLKTTTALAALGAVAVGGWMHWWRPKTGRPIKQHETWWKDAQIRAWALYGACAAWTTTAVATTPGPPVNGVLVALTAVGGGMWWWRHRIRPKKPVELSTAETWETDLCGDKGVLPGATILEHKQLCRVDDENDVIGERIHLQLQPGKQTGSQILSKGIQFASVFRVAASEIAVELPQSRREDQVIIAIYKQDALKRKVLFTNPFDVFDPETGVAFIADYPDGTEAKYRYFRRGDGPVHDLIAGTTGAGKSRVLDMLLSIERHSPLMTSIVIDPQEGQSLPDWTDAVPVYAKSFEEGAIVIDALEQEMYRRNKYLANVEWVDDKGRTRTGKSYFDPTPEMPLLCATIDEAHIILSDKILAKKIENIAKMARKCGIKLRLIVQVPLLDQLGGSTTLRNMVAAGNVIVLRTADNLSGPVAFNGNLTADPSTIPREFDDESSTSGLGYVLGPSARTSISRMKFVEDPYDWASTGEMTSIGAESIALALAKFRSGVHDERPSMDTQGSAEQVDAVRVMVQSEPQKILVWLRERGGPAHTGVIAEKLDIPRANVSTALKRLAGKGQVVKVKHGIWEAAEVAAKPVLVAA